MFLVFQNIDPPPSPSRPGECVSLAFVRGRVFTIFRIHEISYISNVFLGFVCHSKMAPILRNYTKFFLPFFYANLYKIPGISRNSVTFYTNFSTIHHRRHILHTAALLLPILHLSTA